MTRGEGGRGGGRKSPILRRHSLWTAPKGDWNFFLGHFYRPSLTDWLIFIVVSRSSIKPWDFFQRSPSLSRPLRVYDLMGQACPSLAFSIVSTQRLHRDRHDRLTVQGPLKKWTKQFIQSYFLELQLQPFGRFFWTTTFMILKSSHQDTYF